MMETSWTPTCLSSPSRRLRRGSGQEGVEGCDDGNQVDTDECRTSCVVAACGDGVVRRS